MTTLTILAALSVMAAQPNQPSSFGLVQCEAAGDPFVIDDRPNWMVLLVKGVKVSLPRDHELSTRDQHVAAAKTGARSLAVVLGRDGKVTLISIDGDAEQMTQIEDGFCDSV